MEFKRFECHGDRNNILHIRGQVPPKFLNSFLSLKKGEYQYLVGYKAPDGNIIWSAQNNSDQIRESFISPEIFDQKVLQDLHLRNHSESKNFNF